MAGGRGSAKTIALAERRAMALALRKQGGSYREIADVLRQQEGVSPKYNESQAHADVQAALKFIADKLADDAGAVRRLELERLEELHAVYWPRAIEGDVFSLDRVLTIMDRRARYVNVSVPREVRVTGADGGPVVIRTMTVVPPSEAADGRGD